MAKLIPLSRGLFATVDDCDFDRLSAFRWYAKPVQQSEQRFYASRSARKSERGSYLYMHRFVLDAPSDRLVDHINGDGLDNRRSNLRLCTLRQNSINRAYKSASGYRGVQRSTDSDTVWRALFETGGVRYRLGGFTSPEDAARAYDALAREHHGEFAVLNFPDCETALISEAAQ